MKRWGAAIVFLLALSTSSTAFAQAKTESVMHRTWVEERDTGGYYPARSTKGHFSVRSPIPFNDYSIITTNDPNIGTMVMHGVGSRSSDGFEFGTMETERTPRMKPVDPVKLIEDLAKRRGDAASAPRIETIGDDQVVSASLRGKARSAEIRISITPGSVFQSLCEYPTAMQVEADSLCSDYLASFRIER